MSNRFGKTHKQPITTCVDITIAEGAFSSQTMDLHGTILCGFIMPANFTGDELTIKLSVDGVNFYDMYRAAGTQLKFKVKPNTWVAMCPQDFASARFLCFESNKTQQAERTIRLIMNTLGSM